MVGNGLVRRAAVAAVLALAAGGSPSQDDAAAARAPDAGPAHADFELALGDPIAIAERVLRDRRIRTACLRGALGHLLRGTLQVERVDPAQARAVLRAVTGYVPQAVHARIEAGGIAAFLATVRGGLALRALELADEAGHPDDAALRAFAVEGRTELAAAAAAVAGLRLSITATARSDAAARLWLDALVSEIDAIELPPGLELRHESERLDVVFHVAEWLESHGATLAELLVHMKLVRAADEPVAEELVELLRSIVIRASARRDGARLTLALGDEPTEPSAPLQPEVLFSSRMLVSGAVQEIQRLAELWQRWQRDPIGERVVADDEMKLVVQTILDGAASLEGETTMQVVVRDALLEATTLVRGGPDTARRDDAGAPAWARFVPADVDGYWASRDDRLDASLASALLMIEDRIDTSVLRAEAGGDDETTQRMRTALAAFRAAVTELRARIARAVHGFEDGAICIVTSDGQVTLDRGGYPLELSLPAVALLGAIPSEERALRAGRDVLEAIARGCGADASVIQVSPQGLDLGSKIDSVALDLGALLPEELRASVRGDLMPHAFWIDGTLVISTCAALSRAVRDAASGARPSLAVEGAGDATVRARWETTGAALARHLDWFAVLVGVGEDVQRARQVDVAAWLRAIGELLRLTGRWRSETIVAGGDRVTRATLELAAESGSLDAIVATARAAAGEPWPADRVLVATGRSEFLGSVGTFRYVFARDGRFMTRVDGGITFGNAFDGAGYRTTRAGAPVTVARSGAAVLQHLWGAVVSGVWLDDATGVRRTIVADRPATTALALELGDRSPRARVGLDPRTHLPRWFDKFGTRLGEPRAYTKTTLTDYRRVLDRILPHRPVVGSVLIYDVEGWTLEPLTAESFVLEPIGTTRFRFVDRPSEVRTRRLENGLVVVRARIDRRTDADFVLGPSDHDFLFADVVQQVGAETTGASAQPWCRLATLDVGQLEIADAMFAVLPDEAPVIDGVRLSGVLAQSLFLAAVVDVDASVPSVHVRRPGEAVPDVPAEAWCAAAFDGDVAMLECGLHDGTTDWFTVEGETAAFVRLTRRFLIGRDCHSHDWTPLIGGVFAERGLASLRIGSLVVEQPRTFVAWDAPALDAERWFAGVLGRGMFADARWVLDLPGERYALLPR